MSTSAEHRLRDGARRAGHRAVVLNTGPRQPEALALDGALVYRPVPGFGVYAEVPETVFLGKELGRDQTAEDEERSWAS